MKVFFNGFKTWWSFLFTIVTAGVSTATQAHGQILVVNDPFVSSTITFQQPISFPDVIPVQSGTMIHLSHPGYTAEDPRDVAWLMDNFTSFLTFSDPTIAVLSIMIQPVPNIITITLTGIPQPGSTFSGSIVGGVIDHNFVPLDWTAHWGQNSPSELGQIMALPASSIPEPSTYAAILGGFAFFVLILRRCRKSAL